MYKLNPLVVLFFNFFLLFEAAAAGNPPDGNDAANKSVKPAYGKLPLVFEANRGQTDPAVKFLSRGGGYTLFLTSQEAVLSLRKVEPGKATPRGNGVDAAQVETAQIILRLVGANADPKIVGVEELSGKSNYLIGNDPERWRTGIPTYGKVKYENVYPGIDLVYYGHERQLEFDFIVAPQFKADAIALSIEGANQIEINSRGDAVLHVAGGRIQLNKPVLYQEADGVRREISGGYVRKGEDQLAFNVGAYDTERALIIDPVLGYSTYVGGTGNDSGEGIAVDNSGHVYVTGSTTSANFPVVNPALQSSIAGGGEFGLDAFVVKLNPAGTGLIYSTYIGGSADDTGLGIAVDATGSAYITGSTSSGNFPTAGAAQTSLSGSNDAFVLKLDSAGTRIVYSTYLGGSVRDVGLGIALDSQGNAYITGATTSPNFPTVNALQQNKKNPRTDLTTAFVTKLNAAGSAFLYSTYLGGSGQDEADAIAVDTAGNAYVTGSTNSTDFPTANPFQPNLTATNGFENAFVSKFNSNGSALVFSTYLGGSGAEFGNGIAVDSGGNVYVTGQTISSDFPTANAWQPAIASPNREDAFITKLNPAGSALVYSTYLGGSGFDFGTGIGLDSQDNAYVVGFSTSSNFPVANPSQLVMRGDQDAFVARLDSAGTLVEGTYLGGSGTDRGQGIAVDSAGNAYVTGWTASADFPTAAAFQPANGGLQDAFVALLASGDSGIDIEEVVWTDLVGVSANGNTIQKTSCDGCPSGAASRQQIISGDGFVEFVAAEFSRANVGLSNGNPGTTLEEIDFSFGLWPDHGLDVRESGVYRWETTYAVGDILRVEANAGTVRFYKNGTLIYTSGVTPTYPLLVDTVLFSPGATVSDAVIGGKLSGGSGGAPAGGSGTPFAGTPFSVPGTFQAEDFNKGGEGVAYHDVVPGNRYGQYRPNEDVDIDFNGTGGYKVNNFQTGEWLSYSINVTQTGTYRIEAAVSSGFADSRFHVEINGVNVTGTVSVPNTGDWNTFEWLGVGGISLTAGTHILKMVSEQEYFDLDALRVVSGTTTAGAQPVVWTNLVGTAASGNSVQKINCDGCPSGATSQQQMSSGDGYVEFTISEFSGRAVGLSNGNPGTTWEEIDFSFGLWADHGLDIHENGVYRTETTYAVGDVLRIAIEGGVVKYYKNGALFYTSAIAPAYPLLLDTTFFTPGGTVTNAMISAAQLVN
ncbi:MAG TPA: SBBP repeat-containing protein [Candidatus Binatia bacterium]|jgi:hypothetical protein